MDKSDFSSDPYQQAMQLARSPAGKQLIQLLQSNGGDELRDAMAQAAAGDYTSAQKAISTLMQNPEAQRLFRQLGGSK